METEERLPRMRTIPFILKNYGDELGIGQRFLRDLCREGKIRTVKAGRTTLVNFDSLLDYLNGK